MKTKVMFFRPTLGQGGADRVTATLLRHFDRERFDVSIALLRVEGEFLEDIGEDTQVHKLAARSLSRSALPLASLLRSERPEVLFCTSSAANIPAVAAHALSGRRCRLILSERNALLRGNATLKRHIEVQLKRVLYPAADLITVVSQGVGDELVERIGVPKRKISVVFNPVVNEQLREQARESVDHPWFSDDVPVVLAAGRLVPQKDYATLIEAFARARVTRPMRLFILGDGPLKAELQATVDSCGVTQDVLFAGFDKNPFKYMARCAAFVLSSKAEGLPGVLIQAMACGAPAIATDSRHGPKEIIATPGTDGILVPVGDAAAIADSLEWLLADETRRRSIAAAGTESVERFALGASLARYEGAVASV